MGHISLPGGCLHHAEFIITAAMSAYISDRGCPTEGGGE